MSRGNGIRVVEDLLLDRGNTLLGSNSRGVDAINHGVYRRGERVGRFAVGLAGGSSEGRANGPPRGWKETGCPRSSSPSRACPPGWQRSSSGRCRSRPSSRSRQPRRWRTANRRHPCAWSPAKDVSFALMAATTASLAASLAHSTSLTVVPSPVDATIALKIWMPL